MNDTKSVYRQQLESDFKNRRSTEVFLVIPIRNKISMSYQGELSFDGASGYSIDGNPAFVFDDADIDRIKSEIDYIKPIIYLKP